MIHESKPMHVFFSVGEPSGDQHAAHLIKELQARHAGLHFAGFGGPAMSENGCRLLYPLTNLAVMGVFQVLPLLFQFIRLVRQARQYFRDERPDLVVLVDFPGFNWWIARAARKEGIPVAYYLPPQLWAWAGWRIRRVRRYVDRVLCALPFEYDWYKQRGIDARFVGHPFFDEVQQYRLDQTFMDRNHSEDQGFVGILPGSRTQEVTKNFPVMLDIMREVHAEHPDIQFHAACYKSTHESLCRQMAAGLPAGFPLRFTTGKTSEIIELADFCVMVSGSVSLELLSRKVPAVVIYRCGPVMHFIGRRLVKLESVTLPNLIAGRRLYPDFVFDQRRGADAVAARDEVLDWLRSPERLQQIRWEISELREQIVRTGATAEAASAVEEMLGISDQAAAHAA